MYLSDRTQCGNSNAHGFFSCSARFGVHYVDFDDENRTRTPKESAIQLTKIFADNGFPEPSTPEPSSTEPSPTQPSPTQSTSTEPSSPQPSLGITATSSPVILIIAFVSILFVFGLM